MIHLQLTILSLYISLLSQILEQMRSKLSGLYRIGGLPQDQAFYLLYHRSDRLAGHISSLEQTFCRKMERLSLRRSYTTAIPV